jgi:NAD(P)-dependent dehydrogenase (short-subunit alcohol dehydrogenase family)
MPGLRDLSLDGKTAIVTGGSRGIGLAAGRELARLGANVIITSRTRAAAEAAAAGARDAGQVVGFEAHATSEERALACVDFAVAEFGSLDVLVNNAGTNPAFGPTLEQDHSRFAKTFDVNLWAPIMWTRLAVDGWMAKHGGSIINTSSVGALTVGPGIGVYNVSKAGLLHLTRQLAFELSPGIRVNAVTPGVVRTKLSEALWAENEQSAASAIPLGRIGEPDDVASAIAFFASDASSWITGAHLVIDGGQMLGTPEGRGLGAR